MGSVCVPTWTFALMVTVLVVGFLALLAALSAAMEPSPSASEREE